jgi:hypothetical protein
MITRNLREMIMEALEEAGGKKYLLKCAREEPKSFLPLVGRCLPKEIVGADGGPIEVAARLVIKG